MEGIAEIVGVVNVIDVKIVGVGPLCRPRLNEDESVTTINKLRSAFYNHRPADVEVMFGAERSAESFFRYPASVRGFTSGLLLLATVLLPSALLLAVFPAVLIFHALILLALILILHALLPLLVPILNLLLLVLFLTSAIFVRSLLRSRRVLILASLLLLRGPCFSLRRPIWLRHGPVIARLGRLVLLLLLPFLLLGNSGSGHS